MTVDLKLSRSVALLGELLCCLFGDCALLGGFEWGLDPFVCCCLCVCVTDSEQNAELQTRSETVYSPTRIVRFSQNSHPM